MRSGERSGLAGLKMIKNYVVREVRLKVWLLNHSPADTAKQLPRCTVDGIRNAIKTNRKIVLKVRGDKILDAFVYVKKFHVFGFKG